jgi:hypothetical protein
VRGANLAIAHALFVAALFVAACESTTELPEDAGADAPGDAAGGCDPQSEPLCPSDCEGDFYATCDAGAWVCPHPQSAFDCSDAPAPACEAGTAECVCNSTDTKSWECVAPDASIDAPADVAIDAPSD